MLTTGGAAGTWNFITRAPGWALGDAGSPQPNGSVLFIQTGQFPTPPQVANPQNPIPQIWSGVWTPASYLLRDVHFYSTLSFNGKIQSYILIQYATDPITGSPLYIGKFVPSQHGQVTIPVVPSPSAIPLIVAIAAAHTTHRRRPRVITCTLPRTRRLNALST